MIYWTNGQCQSLLLGVNRSKDLFEACTQCGFCQEVCPGGIKHLDLFNRLRQMVVYGYPALGVNKEPILAVRFMKILLVAPFLALSGAKLGRFFLKRYVKNDSISSLPLIKGWFQCEIYLHPPYIFREWWASEHPKRFSHSSKEGWDSWTVMPDKNLRTSPQG